MTTTIDQHYGENKSVLSSIEAALQKAGLSKDTVGVADLGPIDEFHTGGRAATDHLLKRIQPGPTDAVLDIGCGVGGTARFIADKYGASVTGFDLTPSFVDVARELNRWVFLSDKIELEVGDASTAAYPAETFDLALLLHVGMNIEDKLSLFRNVFRMLNTGGTFAIYDVMNLNDEGFDFPVPWASNATMSFVEPLENYVAMLEASGFTIEAVVERGDFAKEFFSQMNAANAAAEEPPPLGLHVLIGPSVVDKMANYSAALFKGSFQPTEIIAVKG